MPQDGATWRPVARRGTPAAGVHRAPGRCPAGAYGGGVRARTSPLAVYESRQLIQALRRHTLPFGSVGPGRPRSTPSRTDRPVRMLGLPVDADASRNADAGLCCGRAPLSARAPRPLPRANEGRARPGHVQLDRVLVQPGTPLHARLPQPRRLRSGSRGTTTPHQPPRHPGELRIDLRLRTFGERAWLIERSARGSEQVGPPRPPTRCGSTDAPATRAAKSSASSSTCTTIPPPGGRRG